MMKTIHKAVPKTPPTNAEKPCKVKKDEVLKCEVLFRNSFSLPRLFAKNFAIV